MDPCFSRCNRRSDAVGISQFLFGAAINIGRQCRFPFLGRLELQTSIPITIFCDNLGMLMLTAHVVYFMDAGPLPFAYNVENTSMMLARVKRCNFRRLFFDWIPTYSDDIRTSQISFSPTRPKQRITLVASSAASLLHCSLLHVHTRIQPKHRIERAPHSPLQFIVIMGLSLWNLFKVCLVSFVCSIPFVLS